MLKPTLAAMVALAISHSAQVAAKDAELWQCQQWKDKIDEYTDLRRGGGSASQMNGWLKSGTIMRTCFLRASAGGTGIKSSNSIKRGAEAIQLDELGEPDATPPVTRPCQI